MMRVAILLVLTLVLSGCWTPKLPQPRPPIVISDAMMCGHQRMPLSIHV
jgi:hypothetical protein